MKGNGVIKRDWKPGEKAVYHRRPVESKCPLCGHIAGSSKPPRDYEVIIVGEASEIWFCPICQGLFRGNPDGWWRVLCEEFSIFRGRKEEGVPYTLLEEIREY